MLKVERAIAFTLPDGSYIKVETTGTGREGAEAGPDDWSALDVTLVRKDESEPSFTVMTVKSLFLPM